MKKKFTKRERRLIQGFVSLIDDEIEIRQGKRFETDVDEKIIYLGYKDYTELDDFFDTWFKKQEFYVPIQDKLITILHEVGHIKCDTIETKKEREFLDSMYYFIYEQGQISLKELNFAYFKIPAEINATKWGVEFYKNNKMLCHSLAEMLNLE